MLKKWIFLYLFVTSTHTYAAPSTIDEVIKEHLKEYGTIEHFSAIQVSIKHKENISHHAKGHIEFKKDAPKLTKHHLFNIGSVTKSFTAALVVKAATENKIKLNETLGTYIEAYPNWQNITVKSLLNMTSGLPNYSDAPLLNCKFASNLKQFWSQLDLIALVTPDTKCIPPGTCIPPLRTGFNYTNTGYVLADLILSRVYKQPFNDLIKQKIFEPLQLNSTFYPIPYYSTDVKKKMAHGYAYNIYTNPELVGIDVTENNLSWAGAAGAIVANSSDVLQWVEALFIRNDILSAKEKSTMQQLVSIESGLPIMGTTAKVDEGFGLGIIQKYRPNIGKYWFYEGETLGYRALYMYVPDKDIIIVALINSATNAENDHSGLLMQALYAKLVNGSE